MIARLTERAEREMNSIDERWREEADYAPDLFRGELLAMLERLEKAPTVGIVFATVDSETLYRVLEQRSRYHVYYALQGNNVVVQSIWSAQRKGAPFLAGPR